MRIKINLKDNKWFYLEVEPYYSIYTVKKKIEHLYGIPSIGQAIKLKDDITPHEHLCLSRLDVKEDDEITVTYGKEPLQEHVRVYCKTWRGEDKLFLIKSNFKVEDLKILVCDFYDLFYENIWLEFPGGSVLDEDLLISDYNIGEHSLIIVETVQNNINE